MCMDIDITALASVWGRREEGRDKEGRWGAAKSSEGLFAQTTAMERASCSFNITLAAVVKTKHFPFKETWLQQLLF